MKYLLLAIVTIIATLGTQSAYNAYKAADSQYQQEIACMHDKLDSGYERKDIWLENGKCYVEINAYYNH